VDELFKEGRPVHFDSNAVLSTLHTVWFPTPRQRCECWRHYGHVNDYYSGIMVEAFPELANLTDEDIDETIRRMRRR